MLHLSHNKMPIFASSFNRRHQNVDAKTMQNEPAKHKEAQTLVHGCDLISQNLRYFLTPLGWLFKFNPKPPHRPRPMTLSAVVFNALVPISIIALDFIFGKLTMSLETTTIEEYRAIFRSSFILRLARVMGFARAIHLSMFLLILTQHGPMSNVIASGNNLVSIREQTRLARLSLAVYLSKTLASFAAFYIILSPIAFGAEKPGVWLQVLIFCGAVVNTLVNVVQFAPLIYACYLSSALGKHVENFSKIYVDSMFDQFMKAIEPPTNSTQADDLGSYADSGTANATGNSADRKRGCCAAGCHWCGSCICLACNLLRRLLISIYKFFRAIVVRLGTRKYPELPEMKMTKLSSTQNIQISETMRTANSHLVRIRLRRTQVMLSELRDLVSDINKTSSPYVLIHLAYDSLTLILITTASIQARVYRSMNVLIVPTLTSTVSLVISVIYICTCLDETTKQLKLMVNKLFDFIIMNHRVQSTGKRALDTRQRENIDETEMCPLLGSETDAISETWSQFQYTRKLANTIQFTMGGILPVTRRLVLSILGHILSAVFISIEIMSIVDTSSSAAGHDRGTSAAGKTFANASTQHEPPMSGLHV